MSETNQGRERQEQYVCQASTVIDNPGRRGERNKLSTKLMPSTTWKQPRTGETGARCPPTQCYQQHESTPGRGETGADCLPSQCYQWDENTPGRGETGVRCLPSQCYQRYTHTTGRRESGALNSEG